MEKSKIKGLEMKVVGAKLIQFKNLFLFFICFQIFTLQKEEAMMTLFLHMTKPQGFWHKKYDCEKKRGDI